MQTVSSTLLQREEPCEILLLSVLQTPLGLEEGPETNRRDWIVSSVPFPLRVIRAVYCSARVSLPNRS